MGKKIVLLDNEQRKAFLNYCETIKSVEKDKDTFLEASRLKRHKSKSQLTSKEKVKITMMICATILVGILLTLAYLSGAGTFGFALIFIGFIAFIIIMAVYGG